MKKYLTLEVQVLNQDKCRQQVIKTYKIGPSSVYFNYLRHKYEGKYAYGFSSEYFNPNQSLETNIEQTQQLISKGVLTPWFYLRNQPKILKTKLRRSKPFNCCPHQLATCLLKCQICNQFYGCPKCHNEAIELQFELEDENDVKNDQIEEHEMQVDKEVQCATCGQMLSNNIEKCPGCNCEIIVAHSHDNQINAGTCVICQEEMNIPVQNSTLYIAITECGHVFHTHCFTQTMARTPICPICQKDQPVLINMNLPVVQALIINKIIDVKRALGIIKKDSIDNDITQQNNKNIEIQNKEQQELIITQSQVAQIMKSVGQEQVLRGLINAQMFIDQLTEDYIAQWINQQNLETKQLYQLLTIYGDKETLRSAVAQNIFFQQSSDSKDMPAEYLASIYQEIRSLCADTINFITSTTL